jgi:hypothetical protein
MPPAHPRPDACERCGAKERLCLWDWVPLWACDDTSACERRLAAQRVPDAKPVGPSDEEADWLQEQWERHYTPKDEV